MSLIAVELKDEELDEVVEKLTIYACSLIPSNMAVRGLGDGPDDLVDQTLRRWWDPSTNLKWNTDRGAPNLGGVIALLKKAMKNLFLDRLKTADYKRSVSVEDDDNAPSPASRATARAYDPEALVARAYLNELVDRVLALAMAAEDTEVVCYIDLQTKEGGPYKNKEAAERLGVEPSDIVNLRKRLDRYTLKAREDALPKAQKAE